ncbi:hypothetical protein FRB91_009715 [Serendipita sp. 411]|nr:hypothetical protein FRB91_009715 [Serendipita sp. 411]
MIGRLPYHIVSLHIEGGKGGERERWKTQEAHPKTMLSALVGSWSVKEMLCVARQREAQTPRVSANIARWLALTFSSPLHYRRGFMENDHV